MIASPTSTNFKWLRRAESRSDADLIGACLSDDEAAWNEFIDRYSRLVYSIARRYGLSEADAEDVHQNVFTIVYRKLSTLRDVSRLSAWLITTTHRECYRSPRRTPECAGIECDPVDQDEPSDECAERWERQQLVRQALRRLGGPCEQLLVALFSQPGRPDYESIALQLGMKVGSIGPTRARCFKKLEHLLEEMGLTEALESYVSGV